MTLKALSILENPFTSGDEPKNVYIWYSYGEKFLTAKFPYGENSVRLRLRTMISPTTIIPTVKFPSAVISNSHAKLFNVYSYQICSRTNFHYYLTVGRLGYCWCK